jgi:hypothetical protein
MPPASERPQTYAFHYATTHISVICNCLWHSYLNINSCNNNKLLFHRLNRKVPSPKYWYSGNKYFLQPFFAKPVRPAFFHYVVCCQVFVKTESKSLRIQYEQVFLIDKHNGLITAYSYINTVYILIIFHSKNEKFTVFRSFPRPEVLHKLNL